MITDPRSRLYLRASLFFLLVLQVATLATGMKFALGGFADFRSFYGAGAILQQGNGAQLYDYDLQHQIQNLKIGTRTAALPYVYPIYAALPFIPLSLLSYKSAFFIFLLSNVALLATATWVMLPYLSSLKAVEPTLPWLLFGCFYPVGIALLQGQVSVVLLLVLCLCFVLIEHGRLFVAGALMSLGLMKFHIVLPIVLLFVLWRCWSFVRGFVTGAAGLAFVCIGLVGMAGLRNYVKTMTSATMTGTVGSVQDGYLVFSSKMPNLHGLALALAGQARWGLVMLVVASVGVFLWTALQPPSFPRAVVTALLVSFHLHLHDLSLLLLPLTLILNESCAAWLRNETQKEKAALSAALLWVSGAVLIWMSSAGLNFLMSLGLLPLLSSSFRIRTSIPLSRHSQIFPTDDLSPRISD